MGDFIVDILNWIIKAVGTCLQWIFDLLPNSPFIALDNSGIADYIENLAWLIPFPIMISISTTWLSCIAIYYIYQVVMRWIKLIE